MRWPWLLVAALAWPAAPPARADSRSPGPSSRPVQPDSDSGTPYETVVRASERQPAAASVQILTADEIERTGARTVQELLGRLPGVKLQDEQGNSLQHGLAMRGMTGSPVTGLPQSISVFLDGVRVNEPAAEEVNFDLLPLDDVERIEVVRGPGAALGRNTLAGAINIVTRRGGSAPRLAAELAGGSFGRVQLRLQAGGRLGPLDGYVSLGHLSEDGFRDQSRSVVSRLFTKVGHRTASTDVTLSYQLQSDRIEQPGSLPRSLLGDRRRNFTGGDFFAPELHLLTLNARQLVGSGFSLAARGSLRVLHAEQFNSSLLTSSTRLFNDTITPGGALLASHKARWRYVRNLLTLSVEVDGNLVGIRVHEEAPDGAPATCATPPCEASPLGSDLTDTQVALGASLQESLRIGDGLIGSSGSLTLTATLRYDQLWHRIVDRSPEEPGAASGNADYLRFTPAARVSFSPRRELAVSFSYAEGFRAPAFLELTCANPAAPCIGLQAGVAPDTGFAPLRAVHAQSYEISLSAAPLRGLEAAVALFRTDLHDDIFSLSGGGTTTVFFQNVGDTRRQGVELSLRGGMRSWDAELSYAYTRATFEEELALASPRTPGVAQRVQPGSEIPLTPRHRANLVLRWRPRDWVELSLDLTYVGSQYLRGDEANTQPQLDGYLTLGASMTVRGRQLSGFLRAENLLNRDHETFGTFAPNARAPGQPIEPFLTPAPPIRVLLGGSYRFE